MAYGGDKNGPDDDDAPGRRRSQVPSDQEFGPNPDAPESDLDEDSGDESVDPRELQLGAKTKGTKSVKRRSPAKQSVSTATPPKTPKWSRLPKGLQLNSGKKVKQAAAQTQPAAVPKKRKAEQVKPNDPGAPLAKSAGGQQKSKKSRVKKLESTQRKPSSPSAVGRTVPQPSSLGRSLPASSGSSSLSQSVSQNANQNRFQPIPVPQVPYRNRNELPSNPETNSPRVASPSQPSLQQNLFHPTRHMSLATAGPSRFIDLEANNRNPSNRTPSTNTNRPTLREPPSASQPWRPYFLPASTRGGTCTTNGPTHPPTFRASKSSTDTEMR